MYAPCDVRWGYFRYFSLFFVVCVCVCVCVCWAIIYYQLLMGFRLSGCPPCVSILVLYVILTDYGK